MTSFLRTLQTNLGVWQNSALDFFDCCTQQTHAHKCVINLLCNLLCLLSQESKSNYVSQSVEQVSRHIERSLGEKYTKGVFPVPIQNSYGQCQFIHTRTRQIHQSREYIFNYSAGNKFQCLWTANTNRT